MPELAYLNGAFMPIEDAMIPIEDRGLQFGDSLYEVIRLYNGIPFRPEAHIARMKRGATAIYLDIEAAGNMEAIIHELAERSRLDSAFIYLQVTRGAAPRNHVIPDHLRPMAMATARKMQPIPEDTYEQGRTAVSAPDLRWARRDIKATTLLPNVLARTRAAEQGAYDAILHEKNGTVTEGSSSNLFAVIGGVIRTHPADQGVLPGISRATILECARKLDMECREESFFLDMLYSASEVFFSDTYCELMPVIEVDGRVIGEGRPGPVAKKLRAAFRETVDKETGARSGCFPHRDEPSPGR